MLQAAVMFSPINIPTIAWINGDLQEQCQED